MGGLAAVVLRIEKGRQGGLSPVRKDFGGWAFPFHLFFGLFRTMTFPACVWAGWILWARTVFSLVLILLADR